MIFSTILMFVSHVSLAEGPYMQYFYAVRTPNNKSIQYLGMILDIGIHQPHFNLLHVKLYHCALYYTYCMQTFYYGIINLFAYL